ncbi:hypothetical protein B0T21DRAFT_70730 [Apiosordaria backusii]|uniref:Uncharacterized protein n=1 Tax=Apiosordaria backusii TaxID=314023 RepID=A0AA40AEJ1_9PEZI|nr:hypothetical protein B0T21DRAFT_70730 [Apiosordaria backusii]
MSVLNLRGSDQILSATLSTSLHHLEVRGTQYRDALTKAFKMRSETDQNLVMTPYTTGPVMTPDIRDARVKFLTKSNELFPSPIPLACVFRVAIAVDFTAAANEGKIYGGGSTPVLRLELKSETECDVLTPGPLTLYDSMACLSHSRRHSCTAALEATLFSFAAQMAHQKKVKLLPHLVVPPLASVSLSVKISYVATLRTRPIATL